MLKELQREEVLAHIDAARQRREYPADFPVLPDVPAARYTDQAFHDLEVEHVFKKSWLYAGHVSELPEAGSFKIFDKLGLSVIVSRDQQGEIRAYHNVCRHRGSALLTVPSGKAKRFVCPYHAWSYNLDGSLSKVPEEYNFGCLNKADHGLIPVRCESWRGLVFINLDDDCQPLLDFLGPVVSRLDGFPLEKLELKAIHTVRIACNWKALRDNFLEVYHVKSVHPQTVAPWVDTDSFVTWNYTGGHGMALSHNPFHRVAGEGKPFPEGTDELFRDHIMGLVLFPNLNLTVDTGGFPFLNFWPDGGPNASFIELPLMGWKDESIPQEYWDNLLQSTLAIADEDVRLLDTIQKSLNTGVLKGMPLGYNEQSIYWYHEQIDRAIGPERLPEAMRVKQVIQAEDATA